MNAKLEVIRLANKDVIATSCNGAWGLAIYAFDDDEGKYVYMATQNGTNSVNQNEPGRKTEGDFDIEPVGYAGFGYYHVKKDGTIIEICPHYVAGNYSEMLEVHKIDIYN